MITIKLNGAACDFQEKLSIVQCLHLLGYDTALVAVAVNSVIIPKREYEKFQLAHEDELDVVTPMQGG